MGNRRFPSTFRARVRARRQSLWLADAWVITTSVVDGVVLLKQLNAAALALRPFTIVRSRGYIHLTSDQEAASEKQAITYGHIVVKDQASAAGVGSVPTPETESGSDWHVFEQLATEFVLGTAVGFDAQGGIGRTFDSKAMRKVDLGDDLIQVLEVGATTISEGIVFRDFSRVLIKLH